MRVCACVCVCMRERAEKEREREETVWPVVGSRGKTGDFGTVLLTVLTCEGEGIEKDKVELRHAGRIPLAQRTIKRTRALKGMRHVRH